MARARGDAAPRRRGASSLTSPHLAPRPPFRPRPSQYAYYGLSALDLKPSWGKYLTMLQITQFCTMIAHSILLAVNQPPPHRLLPAGLLPFSCDFPFWAAVVYGSYVFSLLVLFLAFFERKHGGGKGGKQLAAAEGAAAAAEGASKKSL